MGAKENLSLKKKKALVTGGGGFVGTAVVKRLLELGVETKVVGRNHYDQLAKQGVECIVGSIADWDVMNRATRDVDMVFHVAALAGIWGAWSDYYTTNVLGTHTVLEVCRKNSVPTMVYTSTPSVVFDRYDIEFGDETLPYPKKFLCNYAKSKVMAEKMVLESGSEGFRTCALRPHLIWGPGDPHLLPRIIESGRKKNLKKVGDGRNLVDISYIDNVAEAHILAAQNLVESGSANGKAYFISQDEPVNLWDWINELFWEMDIDTVEKTVSFKAAYRTGWLLEKVYKTFKLKNEPRMTRFLAEQLAKSHYFSLENAKKDLGYQPVVSTRDGLRRTVEWLHSR